MLATGTALQADCVVPSFTNPNNLSIVTGAPPGAAYPALRMADAAVFDYVVLINPAARGLSSVMQNIISLDGTSARRFGQVLLVGSRINGHNVALAAILGRTENGLNYSRLLRHLFNVVPEMAARPPASRDQARFKQLESDPLVQFAVKDAIASGHVLGATFFNDATATMGILM